MGKAELNRMGIYGGSFYFVTWVLVSWLHSLCDDYFNHTVLTVYFLYVCYTFTKHQKGFLFFFLSGLLG